MNVIHRKGKSVVDEEELHNIGRYSFPASLALGLINWGMGCSDNSDIGNIVEILFKYAKGGRKDDIINHRKSDKVFDEQEIGSLGRDVNKTKVSIFGDKIDLLITSPAAFVGLGMIFFNTNDKMTIELFLSHPFHYLQNNQVDDAKFTLFYNELSTGISFLQIVCDQFDSLGQNGSECQMAKKSDSSFGLGEVKSI